MYYDRGVKKEELSSVYLGMYSWDYSRIVIKESGKSVFDVCIHVASMFNETRIMNKARASEISIAVYGRKGFNTRIMNGWKSYLNGRRYIRKPMKVEGYEGPTMKYFGILVPKPETHFE